MCECGWECVLSKCGDVRSVVGEAWSWSALFRPCMFPAAVEGDLACCT